MTNNKKKILILNGSHSEIPLIQAAKKMGFHVITTGNDPTLIGHSLSDEYHQSDFSNKYEILELSKKLDIDAVCSCANDFGAITASYVSEQMGFSGHDSYEKTLILHHKDLFKEFAIKNNIATPYAKGYNTVKEALNDVENYTFPLIIKPIDLTGGKGVTKVLSKKEYKDAVEIAYNISPLKRFVVEEFFEGTQHSFSAFIVNKKVVFYFSDNEYSFLNPYLVSTSAAPADNINRVSKALIENSEIIIKELELVDGIFHIQYLFDGKKAQIIEITRRCSGDLYPYPVNNSTNIDWAEWIVKAEAGFDCFDFPEVKQNGFYGRHCIMANNNGVIKDIFFDDEIKQNIIDEIIWWEKGDIIDNYKTYKAGIVFLKFENVNEMKEKTMIINDLIKIILNNK